MFCNNLDALSVDLALGGCCANDWIGVLGSRRKNEQEGKQLTENKPHLSKQMKVTKG